MAEAAFSLRAAAPDDAPVIAAQRAWMFTDMGDLTPDAAQAQVPVWEGWLRGALERGEYVGVLAEQEGQSVGGAGLMFHPKFPSADDPATLRAYVMNVYVAPAGRRQGVAEAMVRALLAEVQARGLFSVTLHASPQGRAIYERLGFTPAPHPELRLTLGAVSQELPA